MTCFRSLQSICGVRELTERNCEVGLSQIPHHKDEELSLSPVTFIVFRATVFITYHIMYLFQMSLSWSLSRHRLLFTQGWAQRAMTALLGSRARASIWLMAHI